MCIYVVVKNEFTDSRCMNFIFEKIDKNSYFHAFFKQVCIMCYNKKAAETAKRLATLHNTSQIKT